MSDSQTSPTISILAAATARRREEQAKQRKNEADAVERERIWQESLAFPIAAVRLQWEGCWAGVAASLNADDRAQAAKGLEEAGRLLSAMHRVWDEWHQGIWRWFGGGVDPLFGLFPEKTEPWIRCWAHDHIDESVGINAPGSWPGCRLPIRDDFSPAEKQIATHFREQCDGPILSLRGMLQRNSTYGPTIGADVRRCHDVLELVNGLVIQRGHEWGAVAESEIAGYLSNVESLESFTVLAPLLSRILLPGLRLEDPDSVYQAIAAEHQPSARRLLWMAEATDLIPRMATPLRIPTERKNHAHEPLPEKPDLAKPLPSPENAKSESDVASQITTSPHQDSQAAKRNMSDEFPVSVWMATFGCADTKISGIMRDLRKDGDAEGGRGSGSLNYSINLDILKPEQRQRYDLAVASYNTQAVNVAKPAPRGGRKKAS